MSLGLTNRFSRVFNFRQTLANQSRHFLPSSGDSSNNKPDLVVVVRLAHVDPAVPLQGLWLDVALVMLEQQRRGSVLEGFVLGRRQVRYVHRRHADCAR